MPDKPYSKLPPSACSCMCMTAHPDHEICLIRATGDVLAYIFDAEIMIPMCRPCANLYQQTEIAKTRGK